jgi:hypothetical protein
MKNEFAFKVVGFAALVLLEACTAHNPFILANTTTATVVVDAKYPAHAGKVFFTDQSLPAAVAFDPIATIDVGKVWYGSSDNVYVPMADRARQLGANAVVQVKTWHQPAGYSWAAPHGSGQAVHISDMTQLDSLQIQGTWH